TPGTPHDNGDRATMGERHELLDIARRCGLQDAKRGLVDVVSEVNGNRGACGRIEYEGPIQPELSELVYECAGILRGEERAELFALHFRATRELGAEEIDPTRARELQEGSTIQSFRGCGLHGVSISNAARWNARALYMDTATRKIEQKIAPNTL